MKKASLIALSVVSLLGMVGCSSNTNTSGTVESKASKEVLAAVEDAMKLSRDELMKKASEELGSAQLKIEAVTSRGGKPAAINKFVEELAKAGSTNKDPVKFSSTVDGKIYTILTGEVDANTTNGFQGAILQDGYQLQTKFIDKGYFVNYVPKEWADASDSDKTAKDPFTLQYNFKTFMYNNTANANGEKTVIDNVWDITQEKFKKKLFTMDPSNENVNMDFLIQLTDDKWNNVLKEAFEDSTNDNKNLDLSPYSQYGEKKYAYAFIAKFIENAVFFADDGKAINELATTPGAVGWIVYSKIQNIKETEKKSKKNITIAALGDDNTDGANPGNSNLKGFGGFMYKHYMSIMPNAKYPYATCAFFNILSTTVEGYSAWATDVGDYPTLPSINADRTKGGHGTLGTEPDKDGTFAFTKDATKENLFPCLNDPSSTWWNDSSKGNAVIEDASYIGKNYNRYGGFIYQQIANKK